MSEPSSGDGGGTLELVLQLATSGGFAALAWYLIVKAIPRFLTDFRTDLTAQRVDFTAALERIEDAHKDEIEKLRSITMQLVELVRGIPPKA